MSRHVKMETCDDRIVWVDAEKIIYVVEDEELKNVTKIVCSDSAWVRVKGTPDEIMMAKIGTK